MSVFFIGDTHYNHNNIHEKFRTQFSSSEEHDEIIHENILSVSGKRYALWLLGDICFKQDSFPKIKEYTERFQQVHIVLGNHDHKLLANYATEHGAYVHGLVQKYNMWISHCPIHPQEMYRAKMNLSGHLHTNYVGKVYTEGTLGLHIPDPRYLCVSCEQVGYKPISLDGIRDIAHERGIDL